MLKLIISLLLYSWFSYAQIPCYKVEKMDSWKDFSYISTSQEVPTIIEATIQYTNAKNEYSEREIQVKNISKYNGNMYLKTYDLLREEARTFRIDRISAVKTKANQGFHKLMEKDNYICF